MAGFAGAGAAAVVEAQRTVKRETSTAKEERGRKSSTTKKKGKIRNPISLIHSNKGEKITICMIRSVAFFTLIKYKS